MSPSATPQPLPLSRFAAAHGSTVPARALRPGTPPRRLRRALPPFVRALFA